MNVSDLDREIALRRRELDREQGQAKALIVRAKGLQVEIATLKTNVALYEKVSALLNSIGETRQQQAQDTIESLVTMGLQTIFGPELSFHVSQRVSGNKASVEFCVRTTLADGTQIDTDVLSARGGGVAATVGFLLRLVVLLLSKPEDPFLVLDETFSHVSAEYIDRVGQFLKEITEKTNVQIILITHQDELTENADIIYRFKLNDAGATIVTKQ